MQELDCRPWILGENTFGDDGHELFSFGDLLYMPNTNDLDFGDEMWEGHRSRWSSDELLRTLQYCYGNEDLKGGAWLRDLKKSYQGGRELNLYLDFLRVFRLRIPSSCPKCSSGFTAHSFKSKEPFFRCTNPDCDQKMLSPRTDSPFKQSSARPWEILLLATYALFKIPCDEAQNAMARSMPTIRAFADHVSKALDDASRFRLRCRVQSADFWSDLYLAIQTNCKNPHKSQDLFLQKYRQAFIWNFSIPLTGFSGASTANPSSKANVFEYVVKGKDVIRIELLFGPPTRDDSAAIPVMRLTYREFERPDDQNLHVIHTVRQMKEYTTIGFIGSFEEIFSRAFWSRHLQGAGDLSEKQIVTLRQDGIVYLDNSKTSYTRLAPQ